MYSDLIGKGTSLEGLRAVEKSREERCDELIRTIEASKVELSECEANLYNTRIQLVHITEIYRLAMMHFPRLRRETGSGLTQADIDELEKWIGRAKSPDGLKSIVDALSELQKYHPSDIKSSIYAIVQKIIIEGPYPKKKKS